MPSVGLIGVATGYIPKDEFPHSQSTMYMQGGSYIISKDFSDRLAKKTSTKNWNPPFPSAGFAEDAAVGLLLQEEGLPWAARRSDFRFGAYFHSTKISQSDN